MQKGIPSLNAKKNGQQGSSSQKGLLSCNDLENLLSFSPFCIKYRRKIGTSNEKERMMGKMPYLALVASKGWM